MNIHYTYIYITPCIICTHIVLYVSKRHFSMSHSSPGAPPHDGDPQDQHSLTDEDVAKNSGIHEGKYTFSDGVSWELISDFHGIS